ncbi:hypothetical protein VB691_02820, partial [Crocosphaera sp. XPORK-15E]
MLSLPAASTAAPAATLMVRLPLATGVMLAVYVLPSTATKLLAAPLVTIISATSNPITASEK